MKRKKIWYVSKYARPISCGSGRHFSLAREFNQKGCDTNIITTVPSQGSFSEFTNIYNHAVIDQVKSLLIKVIQYQGNGIKRVLSWIDFETKLLFSNKKKINNPDVIIISSLSLLSILSGYYFKKKFDATLVFEVRDIWPRTLIEVGGFDRKNPLVKVLSWIEKFGYEKSDLIVGTMPKLGRHVKKVLGRDKKTYCIPQGVDVDFLKNGEEISEEYIQKYIPRDKFIVGYAGSIGKSNALETLIQCAKLLKENSGIHFLLIGDGDLRDTFKERTKSYNNITFAPEVDKKKVQSVLKYCDVLYDSVKDIPLYDFGLSRNKWIDYMFAGKPIIASYGGYKSMINEAQSGWFVEPGNEQKLKEKLLEVSDKKSEVLEEIGLRGKEWLVENRTYSQLANKYIEIMKNYT